MTEWKTYRLGELVKVKGGKRLPKGVSLQTAPNTHPYIRIRDMGKSRVLELDATYEYVDDVTQKSIARYVVDEGDILLSIVGTIGLVGIVGKSLHQANQTENCVKLVNLNGIDPLFLYYFLLSPKGQEEIKRGTVGAVQAKLPIKNIENIEISLPPLEEQRRIAGILGAIDDKIENNRRINTNLELQAQALYKQWFVDNRSDDWEVGKVSDYYDITIGKTPPRKEKQWFSNSPKDFVWVSISDMGSCGAYISDSSEYLTTKAVDKFNIKVIPNNTVLLSFKLTVGRVAISDGAMTTNEAIAHFNTLNDYLIEYTYLALKAYNFANLGSTSSIATAVNSKIIKSMLWVMPNDNVLRDFHNIVAPIFTQIKNNIRENETLATLRDTLLPKLMNGEIKL